MVLLSVLITAHLQLAIQGGAPCALRHRWPADGAPHQDRRDDHEEKNRQLDRARDQEARPSDRSSAPVV